MINQTNLGAGADAEPRNDANLPDQVMSSGQVKKGEVLPSMRSEPTAVRRRPPNVMPIAHVQALEAYIERRRKLAARIRLEDPARTEEEIEARLEQFGA
jgi:hypothetical protein